MDRLRIGVIGLGWFGEIHCDAIIGIPNLELAALCTRTPERLDGHGDEIRRDEDDARLPRAARRSRHRRGLDRHDVGPAHRAGGRRARGRQACLSREADRFDGRGLPEDHRRLQARPRASCRSGISAASIRATGWRSRRSRAGKIGQNRRHELAAQHSGGLDAGNPQQDRPDRRRRHPRHRPHAVVHRRPHRQRLCADGRRARPQVSRHRPDDVPLRRRRDGDAGDGLVHAG